MRKTTLGSWPVAIALCLGGCQGAASVCRPTVATELPLRESHGKFYVTTLLDGQPATMVLDTGADLTVFDTQSAARLGASLRPLTTSVLGIGGAQSLTAFNARSYQVGRLRFANVDLHAAEFGPSQKINGYDGVIGASFLSNYEVDLDLIEGKAVLYTIAPGCARPGAALQGEISTAPMLAAADNTDPRPKIKVRIDGQEFVALIDSGASSNIIFKAAAERLGVDVDRLAARSGRLVAGAGLSALRSAPGTVASIAIGPSLVIRDVAVSYVDSNVALGADILLGVDFLKRVHVFLSYQSGLVILQYPALPSRPRSQIRA